MNYSVLILGSNVNLTGGNCGRLGGIENPPMAYRGVKTEMRLEMSRTRRSTRDVYTLTNEAAYVLWAQKKGVDLKLAPPEIREKDRWGEKVISRVIDWGTVQINGLEVAQVYVMYENNLGEKHIRNVLLERLTPLPHPVIRVWME